MQKVEVRKLIRDDPVEPLNPSFFENIGKAVPKIRDVTNISEDPEEFLGKLLTPEQVCECLDEVEQAAWQRSGDPRGHTGTGKVVDFSPEAVKLLLYFGSDPDTRGPIPPTLPKRKFGVEGGRAKKRTASTRRRKSHTASTRRHRRHSNRRNRRRTARK